MRSPIVWKKGRGRLGVLDPLLGSCVVESKTKQGWKRFVEHHYRPVWGRTKAQARQGIAGPGLCAVVMPACAFLHEPRHLPKRPKRAIMSAAAFPSGRQYTHPQGRPFDSQAQAFEGVSARRVERTRQG